LVARRTDQLTDAQVWVEEGAQIIPSLLEKGARALLIPVNGYLITISRVISFLALEIGGLEHYPATSTALGLVFTAAVFAWIGTAPLIVRGTWLLPLAVALVPSDVEVFVVAQYSFWFAGLALFSLVLWRADDRSRVSARVAVALVCGLSNPIVVPVALIGAVRALATRARHDVIIAVALAIPAMAQLWVIHASPGTSAMPSVADASLAMARFLAYPLLLGFTDWPASAWIWVAASLHALALVGLLIPADSRRRRLALVGLFLLSAVSSVLRCQPPTLMHPAWAGPRYFFFPFVFLNWIWLDALLSGRTHLNRLVPATVAALILISTSRHFNRRHQHLDWKGAVRDLSTQGQATFPVHYDGSREHQWKVKLARCGNRICQVF